MKRFFLCVAALLLGSAALIAQDTVQSLAERAKKVLVQVEGELVLAGLKEPVEVRRDRWGVPHIYAKSPTDLFFAQGFVAAQDRLFQMELWRRQTAGEMAEILGAQAVAGDQFARLVRYRGDMEAEWTSYSPDTQAIATAFVRGINACIDHVGNKLPIEFQVLGFAPKKWRPEDVVGRMSGIYMSQNFRNEVQRAQLIAALGLEKARWLAPTDPLRDLIPALSLEELKGIDQRLLAGYNAALKPLSFVPAKTESNNWVVAGARSASGKPLLASDPHRAIALPSLRYLVHLNAPGWNVIGAGEPGLPGVAIGHNERIGWGFTIVGFDQADFFVEETNPKNPLEYKVGKDWAKMTVVREAIGVKGQKEPTTVELRYTRHGPVLFQDDQRHRAYALRWAGSEPGGAAYLGSLAVGRAGNPQEFREAMKSWKIPGLNFVYADVDGNIGWIAASNMPIRPRHDGLLPVPGNGDFEWQGFLPVSDLPQSFNPAAGFVATANHNIIPPGYAQQVGYEFAPPYRYQRLQQALVSRPKWTLDEFKALQHDNVSIPGQVLGRLLKEVDLKDDSLEPFAGWLRDWDGNLSVDAKAGPLYALWFKELQEAFLVPHLPKGQSGLTSLPVMLSALEKPSQRWLGGDDARESRDRLVRSTFAKAVANLKKLPPEKQQRWGALHTVSFRHPLATLSPIHAQAFNLGPAERPGEGNTPNNTRYDDNFRQIHGATYRHLLDLADWDRALATSAPGQSGQLGSPHYGDLFPLWAKGEYFPLAFSRKKVEEVTAHRLLLKPVVGY